MKNGKTDITFLIPVRIDSPCRLANLIAVVSYYLKAYDEANFIVLEADDESKLTNAFQSERVEHIFVRDCNRIFHRTKYINMLLKRATTQIAAVWDCDAMCGVGQILEASSILKTTGLPLAYPYDGVFWSVGEAWSGLFRKTLDLSLLTDAPQPRALMCGYHSVGGAYLVDIEKYRQYGWENEHFAGWGPEDAERYTRLEILGQKPMRTRGHLYHLNHPRGVNSGMSDSGLAKSTKKEYCKVCSMTAGELKEYIEGWEWRRD